MNAASQSYLYDVLVDMIHPVRAHVGDRLVVRPGHPLRPVVVMALDQEGDWQPARLGPPNYGALIGLEIDGVISLRQPVSVPLSSHPLAQTA
ncbi:hypothetical protein [Gemmatimonas sp.]|uniref:hypothetical protein n=1 Tax=Gemmatimonas sp. TaxID=1962908 RepID=UPI00333EFEAE